MQKVESSSLFSRFTKTPANAGVFAFWDEEPDGSPGRGYRPWVPLGSTRLRQHGTRNRGRLQVPSATEMGDARRGSSDASVDPARGFEAAAKAFGDHHKPRSLELRGTATPLGATSVPTQAGPRSCLRACRQASSCRGMHAYAREPGAGLSSRTLWRRGVGRQTRKTLPPHTPVAACRASAASLVRARRRGRSTPRRWHAPRAPGAS